MVPLSSKWSYRSKHFFSASHVCFPSSVMESRVDTVSGCFVVWLLTTAKKHNAKCMQKKPRRPFLWTKPRRRRRRSASTAASPLRGLWFAQWNYWAFDVHGSADTCIDGCMRAHTHSLFQQAFTFFGVVGRFCE